MCDSPSVVPTYSLHYFNMPLDDTVLISLRDGPYTRHGTAATQYQCTTYVIIPTALSTCCDSNLPVLKEGNVLILPQRWTHRNYCFNRPFNDTVLISLSDGPYTRYDTVTTQYWRLAGSTIIDWLVRFMCVQTWLNNRTLLPTMSPCSVASHIFSPLHQSHNRPA